MEETNDLINLREELMKLYQQLLDANIEKRPLPELEAIRKKIADITFKLSSDARRTKDIN
jgi:hypothetical protein